MLINKKNNALLAEQAGGEFNCRFELAHKMRLNPNTQAPYNRLDMHCATYFLYRSHYTTVSLPHASCSA
jgi:hypothetical protein